MYIVIMIEGHGHLEGGTTCGYKLLASLILWLKVSRTIISTSNLTSSKAYIIIVVSFSLLSMIAIGN